MLRSAMYTNVLSSNVSLTCVSPTTWDLKTGCVSTKNKVSSWMDQMASFPGDLCPSEQNWFLTPNHPPPPSTILPRPVNFW